MSARGLFENAEEELMFCLQGLSVSQLQFGRPPYRVSDLFDTKNQKLNWFLFINKYEADNQSKFRERKKKIKTPENDVATSWVDLKLNKMEMKVKWKKIEYSVKQTFFFQGFFFYSFYLRW